MARRRSRRRFLTRPLPLFTAIIGVAALSYGLWPSGKSDVRATRLMSEVEPQAPALRPKSSPMNSGQSPAAAPSAAPAAPAAKNTATPVQPPPETRVQMPAPPTTQPTVSRPPSAQKADTADFEAGMAAKSRNELLAAREMLNRALYGGALTERQMVTARQALVELADQTIFSPGVVSGDPLVESHQVAIGDTLGKLAKQYKVSEDLLAEVNRIKDKHFIRQGMRLKVIKGPFHALVTKSDHTLHLFLSDVYVRSYRVALGAEGKTPTGKWRVTSRQANPGWVDPQAGKRYHPDDPANPIGEYWIGLEGIEGAAMGAFGYGIHGTNEPDTIGQDVSLGCIRLAPEDIAVVYKLLLPGASFVTTAE